MTNNIELQSGRITTNMPEKDGNDEFNRVENIRTPAFEILTQGSFSQTNVVIQDSREIIRRPPNVQTRINEIWKDKGSGYKDNPTMLLRSFTQDGGKLTITLGRGQYRDYLAFRSDREMLKTYPELNPQLFTVAAVLETSDNHLVLNQRSQKVFRFKGWGGALGGSVDLDDMDEVGQINPFETARREISEEVGIAKDDIDEIICLGMMRDRYTSVEVMLFLAKSSLTKVDINKKQEMDDLDEGKSIFMRIDDKELKEKLLWFSKVLVTDAAALLTLFGRDRFGENWLQSVVDRLNRRGKIYESLTKEQREIIETRLIGRLGKK